MNKLMGFLELKEMSLPSVPWKQYTGQEKLDNKYLWTIRSAVYKGDDLNLPRLVGENAEESQLFADKLLNKIGNQGMIVYYPYFIAKKSGTLDVRKNRVTIEAVKDDLWNLVTLSDRNVTIIIEENQEPIFDGEKEFMTEEELHTILKYVPEIRKIFRQEMIEGNSVLFEWSYALSCDEQKNPIGNQYLVFYEARTVR